jgi:hypothetical protein
MSQETILDLQTAEEWLSQEGKFLFPTEYSWEWFKRQNAEELVEKDALFIGRGRASDKVTPNIAKVVLAILKRQSMESAKYLQQQNALKQKQ